MPIRAAAVCYRRASGGVEFLLVRTGNLQAWTFPKGHVEPGETPLQAARREAKEEAAVSGRIGPAALTRYRYPVWTGPGFPPGEVCIEAYLLEVTSSRRAGSAEGRGRSWFSSGTVGSSDE
jgi:8-oxo-dGTP pyrophosphatase MutT (NUDIX family)